MEKHPPAATKEGTVARLMHFNITCAQQAAELNLELLK